MKENRILLVSFDFALGIIAFCELLENEKKFVIARQLLRAGSSIGANIREAQNAESKADFIHKMKISAKEADETEYWLELCKQSENYPNPDKLLIQIVEIKKLLNTIISTMKKKT